LLISDQFRRLITMQEEVCLVVCLYITVTTCIINYASVTDSLRLMASCGRLIIIKPE